MPTSSESSIALRKAGLVELVQGAPRTRSSSSRRASRQPGEAALAQPPVEAAEQQHAGTQQAQHPWWRSRARVTSAWSTITVRVQPRSGSGSSIARKLRGLPPSAVRTR